MYIWTLMWRSHDDGRGLPGRLKGTLDNRPQLTLPGLLQLITAHRAISPTMPEGFISNINPGLGLHVPKCVFRIPTAKHLVVSLPPETLPVSSPPPQCLDPSQGQQPKLRIAGKTNGEQLAGSCRRKKKQLKDSLLLLTMTNENSGSRTPMKGSVDELSVQTMESLRWDGVLEDPQAEEKRLELYRANRRQRYISHREALLRENQLALKQTLPNESKENKTLTDQQEQSVN